jgi:hypothetical protein
MNPKDFQLTELLYDRRSILLRAIHASYAVYTQLNITEPLRGDLAESTRRLVTSLLWIQHMKGESVDEIMENLYQFICMVSVGKGEGYARNFEAELWMWANEVNREFIKFQTIATSETDNTFGNQEGGEQVQG